MCDNCIEIYVRIQGIYWGILGCVVIHSQQYELGFFGKNMGQLRIQRLAVVFHIDIDLMLGNATCHESSGDQ